MSQIIPNNGIGRSHVNNVISIGQRGIVKSIKEKCGLANQLYDGSNNWVLDQRRNDYNKDTIEILLSSAHKMLYLVEDEFLFQEALADIEKVLLKIRKIDEAVALYRFAQDKFGH